MVDGVFIEKRRRKAFISVSALATPPIGSHKPFLDYYTIIKTTGQHILTNISEKVFPQGIFGQNDQTPEGKGPKRPFCYKEQAILSLCS